MLKNPIGARNSANPRNIDLEAELPFPRSTPPSTHPPHPPTHPKNRVIKVDRMDLEWKARNAETLAADCRRRIDSAICSVQSASIAALPDSVRALRYAREMAELAIDRHIVSLAQRSETARQLAHPLTLADYVAAARHQEQTHRPPNWFMPGQDINAELLGRMESLAGLVSTLANEVRQLKGAAL